MIQITFDPKNLELNMEGHAGADEKGKDIVCASASMLFYTLAQSLIKAKDMLKKHPIIEWEDGKGHIKCRPLKEYSGNISLIYWTVLNGFELLAEEYSDFVSLKVDG
jgi:uncharacterized protein YsxB (DUF464 family)